MKTCRFFQMSSSKISTVKALIEAIMNQFIAPFFFPTTIAKTLGRKGAKVCSKITSYQMPSSTNFHIQINQCDHLHMKICYTREECVLNNIEVYQKRM